MMIMIIIVVVGRSDSESSSCCAYTYGVVVDKTTICIHFVPIIIMCFVFFLFICVPRREPSFFLNRSDEAIMNDASSMYSITVHMKISGDRSSGCDSLKKDLHCYHCLIEECVLLYLIIYLLYILYNT